MPLPPRPGAVGSRRSPTASTASAIAAGCIRPGCPIPSCAESSPPTTIPAASDSSSREPSTATPFSIGSTRTSRRRGSGRSRPRAFAPCLRKRGRDAPRAGLARPRRHRALDPLPRGWRSSWALVGPDGTGPKARVERGNPHRRLHGDTPARRTSPCSSDPTVPSATSRASTSPRCSRATSSGCNGGYLDPEGAPVVWPWSAGRLHRDLRGPRGATSKRSRAERAGPGSDGGQRRSRRADRPASGRRRREGFPGANRARGPGVRLRREGACGRDETSRPARADSGRDLMARGARNVL